MYCHTRRYSKTPFHQAALKIFNSMNIKTRKLEMESLVDILYGFSDYFNDYGIIE